MTIINKSIIERCSLCLIFVLLTVGCQFLNDDHLVKQACMATEIRIQELYRTDSSKSLGMCRSLLKRFPTSRYAQTIAYLGYTDTYEYWGEDSLAKLYNNKAQKLSKKYNYNREEAKTYLQQYAITENFKDALNCLNRFEGVYKSKNLNDSLLLVLFYHYKGYYYFDIKNYTASKTYFKNAISIAKSKSLMLQCAQNLTGLSLVLTDQNYLQEALNLLEEAQSITHQYCPTESGDVYYQKAVVLQELNRLNDAKEAILIAQKYYNKHPHPQNAGTIDGILGIIYLKQKQYDAAKYYLDLFLKRAIYPSTKLWAYNNLYLYYSQTKDYDNALAIQKLGSSLKDSIYSNDKIFQLNEIRNQFEADLKENQHKATEKVYQYILSICVIVLIVIGIAIYFFYSYTNLKIKLLSIERSSLGEQLEHKKRELISYLFQIKQHNELIDNIKKQIKSIGEQNTSTIPEHTRIILKEIDNNRRAEQDWAKFKVAFEAISPFFLKKLQKLTPSLTELEIKHLVYIKLGLSPKEVAQLVGISPKSVTLSRVRIKKKLQIDQSLTLQQFIQSLDS